MAGVVHIPWYATLFRGDRFEEALEQIAPMMSLTRFTARVLDKIRCSNGVKSGRVGVKITLRLARADNSRV